MFQSNESTQGIHLFYIDTSNRLSMSLFARNAWLSQETHDDRNFSFFDVGSLNAFTTASTSRALTGTPILYMPNATNNVPDAFRVCLFYESSNGSISVLLGKQFDWHGDYNHQGLLSWTWQDMTGRLSDARPGTTFAPPFAVSHANLNYLGTPSNGTFQSFQVYLFDRHNYSDLFTLRYYPDNYTFVHSKEYCKSLRVLKCRLLLTRLKIGAYRTLWI